MANIRENILLKFKNEGIYEAYIDNLLFVYKYLNKNKRFINPYIDYDIIVMGGALYFLLEREARYLGLNMDNIDHKTYDLFKKYKTIDLDLQGAINLDEYDDDVSKYKPNDIKENTLQLLQTIEVQQSLKKLNCILGNDNTLNLNLPYNLPYGFGYNFISSEEDRVESRPQITVNINGLEDHILEMLLQINKIPDYPKLYTLKCLKESFVGEDIISSVTQQIYPNERAWRNISNITKKSKKEVFDELKNIFKQDIIHKIKFNQGYYRVYTLTYIYEEAIEQGYTNLINIITPTFSLLSGKVFYFHSKVMKIVASKHLIDEGIELYKSVKNLKGNALPFYTLRFLKLLCKLWVEFNAEINN